MNLQLSLKTKWFEMTKAGIKTEDYRDINEYWIKRLMLKPYKNASIIKILNDSQVFNLNECVKKITTNTMTLGYPKSTDTKRIIKFEHDGIEIRTGNSDWGAEPNKLYFVIKHGKRL